MSTNQQNFRIWYTRVLEELSKNEHAGFAILLIAFPLLERYLREKSGVHEGKLNPAFYTELRCVFPMLVDNTVAENFWHVYRNGLLHQVTLSQQKRAGLVRPGGWVSGDAEMISIDEKGNFWVHLAKFSTKVTEVIEAHFTIFEAVHSVHHSLPNVDSAAGATGCVGRPHAIPITTPPTRVL